MFSSKIIPFLSEIRSTVGKQSRFISVTASLNTIHRLTRLTVVDNSAIGKKAMATGKLPYFIGKYGLGKHNRPSKAGTLGDKIIVAICGEMKKAYIVGWKMHRTLIRHGLPRSDSNNIVLLDKNGNPEGTRIIAPIPSCLRANQSPEFAKILALATKFI